MENLNKFQGKRPDQYENSAKLAGYSIICMIILLISATLFGGCTTTKECCSKTNNIIEHYENKKQIK